VKLGRALIATLVVASIGAACGSSDEDADAADAAGDSSESAESPEPVSSQPAPVTAAQSGDDGAAADPGTGDAEFGDNGGLAFTFSGGYDASGNYVWVPVASVFTSGWWAMSFTPPNSESAAVFSLLLDPANTNFSFGDGEVTIFGFAPQCSFNIDHQDSSGASGSLDCTGITAITAAGEVSDVNLSATFDATH
jgi:hypothetical protein